MLRLCQNQIAHVIQDMQRNSNFFIPKKESWQRSGIDTLKYHIQNMLRVGIQC